MTARLIIGDVFDALATIPDGSVDLVVTSPPFLGLRSYLPTDHADKSKEIGSEGSPGEFIDTMLDVVEECRRVLAPHGSLVFELGDTYSGSGGAGGDYAPADPSNGTWAMRSGQPKFEGSAAKARRSRTIRPNQSERLNKDGSTKTTAEHRLTESHNLSHETPLNGGDGWPLDKSACLIPQLFAIALSYGINPLTGASTQRWRVRNVVAWCRPNPPVGADGDKFRRATSYLTVATVARDRYWNGDAVRVQGSPNTNSRLAKGAEPRLRTDKSAAPERGGGWSTLQMTEDDGTRPLYDYWELGTQPYKGSHYATYPEMLVQPLVLSMCPERVCLICGQPSRRIVERESSGLNTRKSRGLSDHPGQVGAVSSSEVPDNATRVTTGWTDCGHGNAWRPGVVLDPFAGSGTTLQVATRLGRKAIGIDLDSRNVALVQDRVGLFLSEVAYVGQSPGPAGALLEARNGRGA